jgi:hypothetical protein
MFKKSPDLDLIKQVEQVQFDPGQRRCGSRGSGSPISKQPVCNQTKAGRSAMMFWVRAPR